MFVFIIRWLSEILFMQAPYKKNSFLYAMRLKADGLHITTYLAVLNPFLWTQDKKFCSYIF